MNRNAGLYINLAFARLHLGNTIRKFVREAPPFYYFKDFSAEATEYILNHLTQPSVYTTALAEYRLAHKEDVTEELKSKKGFPQIPVRLITHASELEIKKIMELGGLRYEEAEKVETLWQSIMREYLSFSSGAKSYEAKHSSHYIHLTDLELIGEVIGSSDV